jgi:peptidyl-prolyl cis-trans isomerase D
MGWDKMPGFHRIPAEKVPMLNTFRENMKDRSWPKWLLLVVAASMTLYLAAFFGNGGDGSNATADAGWAVKIDGEAIPSHTFIEIARQLDQRYRQLFRESYSQMRPQIQLGSQAMRELLEKEFILRDARRMGLRVTDEELIARIRSEPALKGPDGEFIGREEYSARINSFYPGGVAAFERELADELLMQKWTDLISQSVSVADADLERSYRERNEKTAIRYFVLPASEQKVATTIPDAELEAWYQQHTERYKRGAGRQVRYVILARERGGTETPPSDDEIRSAYEAEVARYSHPEQRRARHILFKPETEGDEAAKQRAREKAEQTLARLRAGEDFGQLARSLSADTFSAQRGGDLDWFERGKMVAPFDEAVFATEPGQLAPVVESQFGFHVIEVTDARPAGTLPLEAVRDQIEGELRVKRADEALLARARRVRDEIKSAAEFDQAASAAGVEVQRRFINEDEGLREIGASNEFRTSVLALEPGQVSEPLRVAQGLAIAVVDELVPPSTAPLEQIQERVRSDLLNDKAVHMAVTAAEQALARQGSLDRAAKAAAREAQDSGDLAPGQALPGSGGSSPEMREALFGAQAAVGRTGVVQVPSGALAYEIVRREAFDPQAFQAARDDLRTELLQQRRQGMRRSMVDQLSRQSEIEINQELVQRLDNGA